MDPVAVGFETVTALIGAISLFLSRLDSSRQHSEKSPDWRPSLMQLSKALRTWKQHAEGTNHTVREWAAGEIDVDVAQFSMRHSLSLQTGGIDEVRYRLFGERGPHYPEWESLHNLLSIYGTELLEVLRTAFEGRRDLVDELTAELPRLREVEGESLQKTLGTLDLTYQQLDRATTKLDDYIRRNFPLGVR